MRFSRDVPGAMGGLLSVTLSAPGPLLAFDVHLVQAATSLPGGSSFAGRYVLRAGTPPAGMGGTPFFYASGGASSNLRESFEEALMQLPWFLDGRSVQPLARPVIDAQAALLSESAPAMMAFCAAVLLDWADGGARSPSLLEEARRVLDVMEVQGVVSGYASVALRWAAGAMAGTSLAHEREMLKDRHEVTEAMAALRADPGRADLCARFVALFRQAARDRLGEVLPVEGFEDALPPEVLELLPAAEVHHS